MVMLAIILKAELSLAVEAISRVVSLHLGWCMDRMRTLARHVDGFLSIFFSKVHTDCPARTILASNSCHLCAAMHMLALELALSAAIHASVCTMAH